MIYKTIIFIIVNLFFCQLSFSEVVRNGGDRGNLGEIDQAGDVLIYYNDSLDRFFVSSNITETIILSQAMPSSTTQIIGEDKKTRIEVPQETFATTTYISIIDPVNTPELFKEHIEGLKIELAEDNDSLYKKVDNSIRIFSAYDNQGTVTQNFNQQVTIFIPYSDVNQDGIVDGTTIGEASLKMYTLKDSIWIEIPDQIIDASANMVTAPVWHFSVYALRGIPFAQNLSMVYVYPNPFIPDIHNIITFDRVTDTATIKIFTIAGELIKTIVVTPTDNGKPTWNGKNSEEEDVASGIYIYCVTTEEGWRATGKIGIVK